MLSGPTTFVPLINEAVRRVKASKKYHLLLIISDGAVNDVEAHWAALNAVCSQAALRALTCALNHRWFPVFSGFAPRAVYRHGWRGRRAFQGDGEIR